MKQEIALLDMKKNEIGRLSMEAGGLQLSVPDNASHLERDLQRLLELIRQAGAFTVRSSIEKAGVLLEVEEKAGVGHAAYMGAVADFINRSRLHPPRVFAVLRQAPGGEG